MLVQENTALFHNSQKALENNYSVTSNGQQTDKMINADRPFFNILIFFDGRENVRPYFNFCSTSYSVQHHSF